MAEIHISAWSRSPSYGGGGGPLIPATLRARIERENIFGDRPEIAVPVLWLSLGDEHIRVWPADPARLEELIQDLTRVVEQLREREGS